MSYLYQILVGGLHNGMVYALLAYSYVLLFQVVPRPNLAHGSLFAFSGQVLVMGTKLGYNALIFTFASSILFGLLSSVVLSAAVLAAFAFVVVPRFAQRSPNAMIVTTLAIAIVLMEGVHIGAEGRDNWLPPLSATTFQLGMGAQVSLIQVINIIAMLALLACSEYVLRSTSAGRSIRAVAEEPVAAALLGTNVERVVSFTAFASGLLAMTGGLLTLIYIGNMSFGAGLSYGIKVLFIAAAGGFTSPRNAAITAFLFGEAESLWDGYLPILWREAFMYAGLALMLVLNGRPARN
ncbi:branched-chain amino acid ABC transporter permease [Aestuariivirga sp.]|uniref:branched-chain amino acid ABC transporter permease n=1 Tax=Aestuariivirga sp. TaxID=2650926 RepID=UPI0039E36092